MHTQTITVPAATPFSSPRLPAVPAVDQFSAIATCSGLVATEFSYRKDEEIYGEGEPAEYVYQVIESPRGEMAVFLRSDGSSKPARVHMRDPSFVNLQATADMCRDSLIADMIATLAMMDPILGGVDR